MINAYMPHSGSFHLVPDADFAHPGSGRWSSKALCGSELHGAVALEPAEATFPYRVCGVCAKVQAESPCYTLTVTNCYDEVQQRPIADQHEAFEAFRAVSRNDVLIRDVVLTNADGRKVAAFHRDLPNPFAR